MLAQGPAACEARGRPRQCWGGGGQGVSGAPHGPTDKPKPFPAHPVPGLWAAVGRLRLLPLQAEGGFSLMPGGESDPPPCLQGPPMAQLTPPRPHPSPLPGPSTPCPLCDAPWQPAVPDPARLAPLLGEGQESAQKPVEGPLPAVPGSLARPPGKQHCRRDGEVTGQEDHLPETRPHLSGQDHQSSPPQELGDAEMGPRRGGQRGQKTRVSYATYHLLT